MKKRTQGTLGLLIGIVLLVFFWPLGLLFIAAGGLTLVTALVKHEA